MALGSWEGRAEQWLAWARRPGFDSYWRFHGDAFMALLPPPGRLTVEIGCGEGRLVRDLARSGHRVVGVDPSRALVAAAAAHEEAAGAVVVADGLRLPFGNRTADCVVAFMSLQDIEDLEGAADEASRILAPGGHLVLAVTHPLNTAGVFGPGPDESQRPFVISGSWFERRLLRREAERDGLTMTFEMEHRALQAYTEALAASGFLIERITELGEPDPASKWSRIPLFLHVRALRA